MIFTRQEMLEGYQIKQFKSKYQVEIFDKDELLCSYTLNKIKKIVFFTHELDSNLFKKFIRIKNELNGYPNYDHDDVSYENAEQEWNDMHGTN